MSIYVTADQHFFHDNIIKYCERPFENVEHMDYVMKKRWNEVVDESDVIYHLGDFALGTKKQIEEMLDELNGYKILIRGNHDKSKDVMKKLGFDEVYSGQLKFQGNILSHKPFDTSYKRFNVSVELWDYEPIPMPKEKGLLIHGHTHNNNLL